MSEIKETWDNYRKINRLRLDGVSFADIAVQFDDTEEHISDFWQRYHTFKQEQKKKWDADHKEETRIKAREYKEKNRDRINEYARQHRKDHPEVYEAAYQRRKKRAEERGVILNDPVYQKNYRLQNFDRLQEYRIQYEKEHSEEIKQRRKMYYETHREAILQYHVDYNLKNREMLSRKSKAYRISHRDEISERRKEKYRQKRQEEVELIKRDGSIVEANIYRSSYENIVADYLYDHEIRYCYDKSYNGLTNDEGFKLRYDFYLIDFGILIEIDGEQHFHPVRFNGIDEEQAQSVFERTKYHDELKNAYCEENGIPLIRIPYYMFKNDEWKTVIDSAISEADHDISA